MKIISKTINFQMDEPTAVVIGKFDGIHLGHQHLISKLIEQKKKGLKTVVFTFDRSPSSLFLQDKDACRELCTLAEKRSIFRKLGPDVLIEFPMKAETASIPAEEFITEILQKKLCCNILIAGEDVSFGYRGLGNSRLLMQYSSICGFQVEILDKLLVKQVFPSETSNQEISSTLIRSMINAGNVKRANVLLGRAYSVCGEVVHGRQLAGGLLDMPTANVKWPDHKVIPIFGVYFTQIIVESKRYPGITNVGRKPTVTDSDQKEILAESFLYHFNGDLYGKDITIEFYAFVRPEQKFTNLEVLKAQMQSDLIAGKSYWESNTPPKC